MQHLQRNKNRLPSRRRLSLPLQNGNRQSLRSPKRSTLKRPRQPRRSLNHKPVKPSPRPQNQLRNLRLQNQRQSLQPPSLQRLSLPQNRLRQSQGPSPRHNQGKHALATTLSRQSMIRRHHGLAHAVGHLVRETTRSHHSRGCGKNAVEVHVQQDVERQNLAQVRVRQKQDQSQVKNQVLNRSNHVSLVHVQHRQ